MTIFEDAIRVVATCEGYALRRTSLSIISGVDSLQFELCWEGKPSIVLSLDNIHHFSMSGVPGEDQEILESISIERLPPGLNRWPEEIARYRVLADPIPELIWIRVRGPFSMDIVSASISVYVEDSNSMSA
ncbi:hypothetical protein OG948_59310 (plasmid) [Embleya sp. NBC_00888]|uniref:hypothetical protein n=1 Tax=Embleya sp. NBC_00888 TaxID=2975960 RepID=UPI002F9110F0|nr:hypothetical protein OG948_33940 [Embleya sp. NBC_00888]WSY48115.1 hypothetical protein OG948_59310 [Embleya sp. NBC_00888]